MSLRNAFDSPEAKRRYVRQLFSTIADRYDLITALLSYGQDARWKRTLVALANVRSRLALMHDLEGQFRAGFNQGLFQVRIEVPM